ncbi:MAG: crossover junction endodeoxyribonuclease RuvC [Gemmatimonadota bacterium]|nr:crossover junction endodeoxyribonuclease RuvC [Gemmatimonadota bacterium]MDE2676471.1 crossover junction endodeoxyribonuclease RuvC [Gemmatimonadota bacterium]
MSEGAGGLRGAPGEDARNADCVPEAPEGGRRVLLGIDPGTAVTGFGVVTVDGRRRTQLLQCGVIRTSPRAPLALRLMEIHEEVAALIDEFSPAAVCVESAFYGKNVRSALTLGQARGAIIVAAAIRGVEVVEYAPREIKKAVVGTGAATKDQVAYMVRRHLRLATDPKPNDAADGIAAALCHAFTGQMTGRSPEVRARALAAS